eukprot:jgi/Chlat1/2802/Chrsp187S02917
MVTAGGMAGVSYEEAPAGPEGAVSKPRSKLMRSLTKPFQRKQQRPTSGGSTSTMTDEPETPADYSQPNVSIEHVREFIQDPLDMFAHPPRRNMKPASPEAVPSVQRGSKPSTPVPATESETSQTKHTTTPASPPTPATTITTETTTKGPIRETQDQLWEQMSPRSRARKRWHKLRTKLKFATVLAVSRLQLEAASMGVVKNPTSRGKAALDSLVIKQHVSTRTAINNFYIIMLKRPLHEFIMAMFLVPVALSLLFTPLFWLDVNGFKFEGDIGSSLASKLFYTALYSLSLSTTFGGAPMVSYSAYTLILSNLNMLMAQLTFVFLSGAVFSRLSQPAQPIRCSRYAIIKEDELLGTQAGIDFVPDDGPHRQAAAKQTFAAQCYLRSFSARLVLTGPMPNELIDVRISLTYRSFLKTKDGGLFVSMQPLSLVRADIPFLRHGLMVRHVIDRTSPLYGHTPNTLYEQDAGFSLTVMGIEKTSMQQIFHRQEYCVNDGDVLWDADWVDMVFTRSDGRRVMDHSKLDTIHMMKNVGVASRAITRMAKGAETHRAQQKATKQQATVKGKSA